MHHGVVKWFKTVKGYGFIAGDDGKEIFVHHSDILMNGFRNLEVGQRVSYQIEQTENADVCGDGINELVSCVIKCPEFSKKDYLGHLFYKRRK